MWLYVPCTPAPDTEASSLRSRLPALRLAQSATWRGKRTPLRSWSARWKRGGWIRLLSGLTLRPSTARRGVEQWISSLRDSPANRSASPASESESPTNGSLASGRTSHASSASADPRSSSWRMSCSMLFDDPELTWRTWASESRQRSESLRLTLELRIAEIGGGCLPMLPTPACSRGSGNVGGGSGRVGPWRPSLDAMAARSLWPTPRASDGEKGGPSQRGRKGDLMLSSAVRQWPTPSASDGMGSRTLPSGTTAAGQTPDGRKRFVGLNNAVKMFPAPRVTGLDGGSHSRGAAKARGDWPVPPVGGTLNPAFVCWLMGVPIGWTDCTRSATESCRWLELSRGMFCRLVSGVAARRSETA